MKVVCTSEAVAYVPDDSPGAYERYNLLTPAQLAVLDLDEVDPRNIPTAPKVVGLDVEGGDGTAILVDKGCGVQFDFDLPDYLWDANVNAEGFVLERHIAVPCPDCGKVADHLSKKVQGHSEKWVSDPFERMILHDPIFDNLSEDERTLIIETQQVAHSHREKLRGRGLWRVHGGADAGYSHVTEGAVALAAATAKSVIGGKAGSAAGLQWTGHNYAFDGVTASAVPVAIELCYCTFGANSPGTNSTGTTERQLYGRVISADWTGGRNWTAEPTTLTVIGEGLLSPNGGVVWFRDPLATEPDSAVSEGFVIRLTAPAVVNVRAGQTFKRC